MSWEKSFVVVAAAIGSFLVVTLLMAASMAICRKRKKQMRRGGSAIARHRGVEVGEESKSFEASLRDSQISMENIRLATRNFSPDLVVGDGSFGMVYKAELSCGRTVAVKKLDPDAFQGLREFRAEIETLGRLRHPNLARIVGFCASGPDRIIVYDFVEKGNLDWWLHLNTQEEKQASLSWDTRVEVALGVAKGLEYLHGLRKQIIHRDIKSSNVLLDGEFGARISDFGLARTVDASRSHVSTQAAGTMGYMPPEYKEGYTVATVHADVYSFGVLMVEIATGRRPNLPVRFDNEEMGLVQWARGMAKAGRHLEMLDPRMPPPHPSQQQAAHYFHVACQCANDVKRDRPPMSQVLSFLDEV